MINFLVDPLWTFQSTQTIDIKQKDFNERVQKTNYLAYKDNGFDAILLGNSRATYINQNDFDLGYKVFNYAVNAMPIDEYDSVIKNFVALTKKEPKVILLGIDLFNIGRNQSDVFKQALLDTQSAFSRYKNLFSLDIFLVSCKNLYTTYKFNKNIIDRKQRFYDKHMQKGIQTQNTISNKHKIEGSKNAKISFNYSSSMIDRYKQLQNKYPNSKFIVFTMPVHSIMLEEWGENKKFMKFYALWLNDLVQVFGSVNHFLYDTDISRSYTTFFDAFHFYPNIGNLIAKKVSDDEKMNAEDDFGIILNKTNIDDYLHTFAKGKTINAL
ncbi:MAG: hypothetical protein U9N30_10765 [Campylobacterota bacterium]|nr:hypothetical protein [Campylobacterota bacterium]